MKKAPFLFAFTALLFLPLVKKLGAQAFLFGADLSYVNEMEDCGVVYQENGAAKDPYLIFADNNCRLVRLRLWHTPAWYDELNAGQRYADLQDVRKSSMRAKAAGMQVLLDFHLSDNWADPEKQRVPAAWEAVVNDLPVLKDSLYNYISQTLLTLNAEGLLPEMVQIGNETNKGILLSPQDDTLGWVLDWNRNSQLFKRAIEAVREVESQTGKKIQVALHLADPSKTGWYIENFWNNGVTDFDIIGMSYYWAWHKPVDIGDVGNIVATLKQTYPSKKIMIFETGYLWTTASNDNANNILTAVHPGYAPASPENQQKWLVDMTQEVIDKGASGVIYWEPAWVSSPCWTQWGQGSHQENATFFDFQNDVLPSGGMGWMTHPYENIAPVTEPAPARQIKIFPDSSHHHLLVELRGFEATKALTFRLLNMEGRWLATQEYDRTALQAGWLEIALPQLSPGIYILALYDGGNIVGAKRVWLQQR